MNNVIAKYSIEDLRSWRERKKIQRLEAHVFKKTKPQKTSEAQRFLISFHLGLIEPLINMNFLSQNKKDKVVSDMLNINIDNARKFLAELTKKRKPLLETKTNYAFLLSYFEQLGYEEKAKEVDLILIRIRNYKENA